ncbi:MULTISPECIES: tetratricopeptide repeat protein [unclassified Massilia]|uniref:tetratricopeptide repeat protein n=1 Tax=unclassified Massilia TaxID=2609279 RepID=UPI00178532B4|nr:MULTISPECIES: tetratricopeptide repeat protein [unclassified Massilia]MBD8529830.1 tetratricopeptide repeat protein [Massilia sp. CFBP 13647]MBD8672158.1 tetratricopeptide repeat protein [Massilia sp. CFBP 13721]
MPGKTFIFFACACLLAGAGANAAPYIPSSGAQVLERLPGGLAPARRALQEARSALRAHPHDLALATNLAQRYIEQSRRDGDPRYLGYAQAALAPWWDQPQPPSPVLVLRATLRQSTHQFGAALADLDTVLQRDSGNSQAWLTRATVQTITGDFGGARASCMRLYSRAPQLVVQACLSSVGSVSGDAGASYERLRQAHAARADAGPELRAWSATLLGEMAARLGRPDAAEAHFREALALDPADSYLLGAYADFLLERGRAVEVVALLRDKTQADALLLRHAIALKTTGAPGAAQASAELAARFDAAMRRRDNVHQREQARYELALRGDAPAAVRLAKLNWAVQREPADLRILAQAALASRDPEAQALVRAWLASSRLEDAGIAATVARLGGKA